MRKEHNSISEPPTMKSGEDNQDLYKIFISQNPGAIAMLDYDMNYLLASAKWLEEYSLSEDIYGTSFLNSFPYIDNSLYNKFMFCLQGRCHSEQRVALKKGIARLYVRLDITPWYKVNGAVGGLIICIHNITDEVEKQKQQKRLSDILRNTQNLSRIGAWHFSVDTKQLEWDYQTKIIHEVNPDFVPEVDTALHFYKEGESRDIITKEFGKCVQQKYSFDVELQLRTASGKEIWVRAMGKSTLGPDGRVSSISGLFQDIHETKKKEIALEESRNRFEGAFQYSALGMALVTLDGQFLKVNRTLCDILQFSPDKLKSMSINDVTHEDDLDKDLLEINKMLKHQMDHYQVVKRFITSEKQTIWTTLSVAVVRNSSKIPLYFVIQLEDITGKVKANQKLEEANQKLQVLTDKLTLQNKSLSDFAHITSHNLRSPVGNLLMLLEMLDSSSDHEKHLLFDKVKKVSFQLKETLDDLMEALLIKEQGACDFEEVNLVEVFDHTYRSLEASVIKSNAVIHSDFSAFSTIYGNRRYFESIFLNLITNAIKYRSVERNPEIFIRTNRFRDKKILSFIDNGLGIDLNRHGRKIFGLHKTFHRNSDAKGVGLFMVKMQVEAMGGSIDVKSTPEVGTTFTLTF